MTTNSLSPKGISDAGHTMGWSIAGDFLAAFSRRDFAALTASLDPDVAFRALLPHGPLATTGADEVVNRLNTWFGGDDDFEILDASIGQVGQRMYLRWRIRMHSADSGARIAEQHVFTRGEDRIVSLDLLCSGFQSESAKEVA
ncbi:nuclear transport factor 2 family protein [Aldersonia sp. NBC_00410]|uniref:nuclear transport factor 2 family protein n=1 Tax=Aldersonia sp. NBC_00410 TaxID=2975954 RepID=UPI00224F1B0E|nr:nuclear transport factor 2 family protein [Aldersonia sp. NBC_00410]MCX5043480.1 nuclear transport factor 2 family protein [Aldersonia sp. NBC_00410]